MFDIFVRKSKVVVDCFTDNNIAFEYFKIAPSNRFIPKWWRDLPSNSTLDNEFVGSIPDMNMRGCVAFTNLFNKGFILPLWSDLVIDVKEDGFGFFFANRSESENDIKSHPPHQYSNAFPHFYHLKINSPWFIKESSGIKFHWNHAFWSYAHIKEFIENFWVIPGIIDFDINPATNINIFCSNKLNNYMINAGLPLVHIIPFTDKKVDLRCHYVEDTRFIRKSAPFFTFNNKKLEQLKKQQCPISR